jgi:ubiquinone biosynthesis protein
MRAVRHLRRMASIARTLARYDALFPLARIGAPSYALAPLRITTPPQRDIKDLRPGVRLTRALHALGPSFIKLGQAFSVRPDLVGEELADDLATLQDHLPPFPAEQARRTIEAELGKPIAALFESFDDTPVAAASIAQVHRAVTTEGVAVAVKVLRPDVEAAFARDLDLLLWLAEIAERRRPDLARLKPVESVRAIAETVASEMDLRYEAAAADELRGNFADDPYFRVPPVDWRRTARRVLTIGWVGGVPVDERERLVEAGLDPRAIVAHMARTFFLQVFRDGFFHADLHPGNLFVDEGGAINAVDFGIMGRMDRRTRLYLAEMLLAFLNRDYKRVADVHIRAGFVPPDQSAAAFAQAARSIAEPILDLPMGEISLAALLAQLFQVTEKFRMPTQPKLLLLQKTMLVAEGVGRRLAPDTNMWELARPLIMEWAETYLSAEAQVAMAASDLADALARLPALIENLEESVVDFTRHGLKLHPDTVAALAAANQGRRARWR